MFGGGGLGGAIGGVINRVKDAANAIAPLNPVAGGWGAQLDLLNPNQPEAPQAPGEDPRLKQMQEKRVKEAEKFRADLPETKKTLTNDLREQSRRALAEDMAKTRGNYAKRGLLHSGLREGGEARVRGSSASAFAQGRMDLEQGLDDQASQMENQAVQSGLDYYQTRKAASDAAYNAALQKVMNNRSLLSGAASGAGGFLGMKAGGG